MKRLGKETLTLGLLLFLAGLPAGQVQAQEPEQGEEQTEEDGEDEGAEEEEAPEEGAEDGEAPEEGEEDEEQAPQEETTLPAIQFSEEQRRLNNKATEALAKDPPDTETAVRNIEAALAAGDAGNVLYLSLGRAHQKAGRCETAAEAFEEARTAPPVEGVPNDAVMTRLERFTGELDQCFGTLRVACESPDDTRLRVSGRDVKCDERVKLDPATHIVTARRNIQRVDIPVDLKGGEETRVHVDLTSEDGEGESSIWEGAIGRTKLALGVAEDAAKARAEEQQRRHRESAGVSAQITSERVAVAAERVALATERVAAQKPEEEEVEVAASRENVQTAPTPEVERERAGDLWAQFALHAPVGGYAVERGDGFADGGFLYGVGADVAANYVIARGLGADVHMLFDYTLGEGLGVKRTEGGEGQQLGQRHWRLLAETRAWLVFVGLGFFTNHRSQTLISEGEPTDPDNFWSGGPSLTFSTKGLARSDGYFDLVVRWAPLFGGSADHVMGGIEVTTGYLMVSMFYETFSRERTSDTSLVRGETLTLRFGLRIPVKTNVSSEPSPTAELEANDE